CQVDNCMPTKANCYPPPDCPPAVQKAASGAKCVEANPLQDLSDVSMCSCGCLDCSIACDGEGLVWGQSLTLGLALPRDLPARGSLGLMLRARGSGGMLDVGLTLSDMTTTTLDSATLTPDFADWISTTMYSWTSPSSRPTSIQLTTDTTATAEVDCVVPYLA